MLPPPLIEAVAVEGESLVVESDALFTLVSYLSAKPLLAIDYLGDLTAIDYLEYIELNYRLLSLEKNELLIVKVRLYERENPSVASITPLLTGADFQEREVYDLMGVTFYGHPSLKRLLLWEGFPGHPLRKDYVS